MHDIKNKIRDYWNRRAFTFDLSPGHVISSKEERSLLLQYPWYC